MFLDFRKPQCETLQVTTDVMFGTNWAFMFEFVSSCHLLK